MMIVDDYELEDVHYRYAHCVAVLEADCVDAGQVGTVISSMSSHSVVPNSVWKNSFFFSYVGSVGGMVDLDADASLEYPRECAEEEAELVEHELLVEEADEHRDLARTLHVTVRGHEHIHGPFHRELLPSIHPPDPDER
jgi:hypothetical protein